MSDFSKLSEFEISRQKSEQHRRLAAEHAFALDWREWGWFEPGEWFAAVSEVRACNEAVGVRGVCVDAVVGGGC